MSPNNQGYLLSHNHPDDITAAEAHSAMAKQSLRGYDL